MDSELSSRGEVPDISVTVIRILASVKPESLFLHDQIFAGSEVLDSLDLIRLVGELDEAFGVSIEGVDMLPQNFESVEAISALVRKYKQEVSPDG